MCQFTNSCPPHPPYQSLGALLGFLPASSLSLRFMSVCWAEFVWCLTHVAASWFHKIEFFSLLWSSNDTAICLMLVDCCWFLGFPWMERKQGQEREREKEGAQPDLEFIRGAGWEFTHELLLLLEWPNRLISYVCMHNVSQLLAYALVKVCFIICLIAIKKPLNKYWPVHQQIHKNRLSPLLQGSSTAFVQGPDFHCLY